MITGIEYTRNTAIIGFDDGRRLTVRKKDTGLECARVGSDGDYEDVLNKVASEQFGEGYEAALTMLDFSARTAKEIENKLLQKGYVKPVCEAVIEKLKQARLIDDELLAQNISYALENSGKGKFAIVRKLRSRGIDSQTTENIIDNLSEEAQNEGALKEANRLYKKYASLDRRDAKNKLSRALATRGFTWDSIEYALERVFEDE